MNEVGGTGAGPHDDPEAIMIMMLVQALGVTITPVLRFMLSGFELISIGAVVLRVVDAWRSPRLGDLAAQRRERWDAVHTPSSGGELTDPYDD